MATSKSSDVAVPVMRGTTPYSGHKPRSNPRTFWAKPLLVTLKFEIVSQRLSLVVGIGVFGDVPVIEVVADTSGELIESIRSRTTRGQQSQDQERERGRQSCDPFA